MKPPPIEVVFEGLTDSWCVRAAEAVLRLELLIEQKEAHARAIYDDAVDQAS